VVALAGQILLLHAAPNSHTEQLLSAAQQKPLLMLTLDDETLCQFCEQIAREFQPERIILFGSHAYGKPHVAEELAQDALVTALELWPEEGVPENPGAWLMKAAKRRAIDALRRGHMLAQKHEVIARELEWRQQRLADALERSMD